MLEGLARLPGKPGFLITTAGTQEGSALLREIVDGPPLFRTTSFGDEIEIYRTRYGVLEAAPRVHIADGSLFEAVQGLVDASVGGLAG